MITWPKCRAYGHYYILNLVIRIKIHCQSVSFPAREKFLCRFLIRPIPKTSRFGHYITLNTHRR